MRIALSSITVDDQDKALAFYTEKLGFVKKTDIPMGLTNDIAGEYRRLDAIGVNFRGEPTVMGPITAVLFEDTCGNLINLVQPF